MNQITVDELKQAVTAHAVCYEVWPEYAIEDGKRAGDGKAILVGFSLELYGTHDHGACTLSPACEQCVETYDHLRRIAEWIVPRDSGTFRFEIASFDRSLDMSVKRHFRPEILVDIKIFHSDRYFDPVDASEERCLRQMEESLHALGVHRGN